MSVLDPATAGRLNTALASGANAVFAAVNELFLALPGVRTVTWLAARPDQRITVRVGTSDTQYFPIGGVDPIDEAPWSRRIYGEKLPIVTNTPAEMAVYVPETEDLVKLGYGSLVCAPIIIDGAARGTVNVIGATGAITPSLLAEINTLLPIAALIFTFTEIRGW
jgi:hypothetical protein